MSTAPTPTQFKTRAWYAPGAIVACPYNLTLSDTDGTEISAPRYTLWAVIGTTRDHATLALCNLAGMPLFGPARPYTRTVRFDHAPSFDEILIGNVRLFLMHPALAVEMAAQRARRAEEIAEATDPATFERLWDERRAQLEAWRAHDRLVEALPPLARRIYGFDWSYEYSDDGDVQRAGSAREDEIVAELALLDAEAARAILESGFRLKMKDTLPEHCEAGPYRFVPLRMLEQAAKRRATRTPRAA
jgi:hypothetical protein